MNTKTISNKLKKIFSKYELKVGILFGSYASNSQKETSDVDIAFYPNYKFSSDNELTLREEIEKEFKNFNVDIVNVAQSNNLLLIYNIFKDGICIYEENSNLFKNMKLNAWMDYVDFNSQYKEMQHRIREKNLQELVI